jgi:hypothetical protein
MMLRDRITLHHSTGKWLLLRLLRLRLRLHPRLHLITPRVIGLPLIGI